MTKALQFLIPIQLATTKQWWSNPSTQWSQYLPIKMIMSQILQCDDKGGLIILHVLQYLYSSNRFIFLSVLRFSSYSSFSIFPLNNTPGSLNLLSLYQSLRH